MTWSASSEIVLVTACLALIVWVDVNLDTAPFLDVINICTELTTTSVTHEWEGVSLHDA